MLPVFVGRLQSALAPERAAGAQAPGKCRVDLVRQSSIENYLRAYLTVMDRNPQAVEKALMNEA
jgi:hypothetical protein